MRVSSRHLCALLVLCGACSAPDAATDTARQPLDEEVRTYIVFDSSRAKSRRWRGQLLVSDAEENANLVKSESKDSIWPAWTDHGVGNYSWTLLGEKEPVGSISLREDATLALALDRDRDRVAELVVVGDLITNTTLMFFDEVGARILDAWHHGENPLCMEAGEVGDLDPAEVSACGREGDGSQGGSESGGGGFGSPGAPIDPLDMLCAGVDLSPRPFGGLELPEDSTPPPDTEEPPTETEEPTPETEEPAPETEEPPSPEQVERDQLLDDSIEVAWHLVLGRAPSPQDRTPENIEQVYDTAMDVLRFLEELGPFRQAAVRDLTGRRHPIGPEGATSEMLRRLCLARQDDETLADRVADAIERDCFDPAESGSEADTGDPSENCFGRDLEPAGDVADIVRSRNCMPGDMAGHCDVNDTGFDWDRVRNLRFHGEIDLRERCDPTVCRPGG